MPKCAGRTVQSLLDKNYENRFVINDMNLLWKINDFYILNEYDLIEGHIIFDYVKHMTNFKKFSIFRNPIDRTLSEWEHLMNMDHNFDVEKNSFEDFLTTTDVQAKMLTNVYCSYLGDRKESPYDVGKFFKRALDALISLDFVGIFERLDETIDRLKKRFNLEGTYTTTGITPDKYKMKLTDKQIELARKVLRPDMALYELALQKFEGQS